MGDPAPPLQVGYLDDLTMEARTGLRHEWRHGVAIAMAGGTPTHSALGAAVVAELRALVRGRGCVVYNSDLKVRLLGTGEALYPDASVVCGGQQVHPDDRNAVTNPVLLVEVLSPGSEADDRGEKFRLYRKITSLQHYVLVSQDEACIELYTRRDGRWVLDEATAGGQIDITALGGSLSVDAVYEGVDLAR